MLLNINRLIDNLMTIGIIKFWNFFILYGFSLHFAQSLLNITQNLIFLDSKKRKEFCWQPYLFARYFPFAIATFLNLFELR